MGLCVYGRKHNEQLNNKVIEVLLRCKLLYFERWNMEERGQMLIFSLEIFWVGRKHKAC